MMNRTIQYFKNIKLNPLVNKTLANEDKKHIILLISIIAKKSISIYN